MTDAETTSGTLEDLDEKVVELAERVEIAEGAIRGLHDRLVKSGAIAPPGANRHDRRAHSKKRRKAAKEVAK